MLKVGIAGGSGYSGVELISILLRHPGVELSFVSGESTAGVPVHKVYPHLRGLVDLSFVSLADVDFDGIDVLFLALPHGKAMELAPSLPDHLTVIDLSGDFRINDPDVFAQYYGFNHTCTTLQGDFVYGLSEVNRKEIAGSKRIANPGCFATTTLLALYPLYQEGWINGPVFVDSKTGSSGSGRTPGEGTHHPRRSNSFFPYKPFRHQHLPEMRQVLDRPQNPLIFQAHSAPMVRGIFASHYMQLSASASGSVEELYRDYYGSEPFIRWVPTCPDVSSVLHSNFTDIGASSDGDHLIVWSTLDNLQKGAAGQAVQNLNIACGLVETTALFQTPSFP